MFLKRKDYEALVAKINGLEERISRLENPQPSPRGSKARGNNARFKWHDIKTVIEKRGQVYSPDVRDYTFDHDGMRINILLLKSGRVKITVSGKVRINVNSRRVEFHWYYEPDHYITLSHRERKALDAYSKPFMEKAERYLKTIVRTKLK